MSDEIKEILELFAFADENIMFGDIVELNSKQSHLLLDYITNLQNYAEKEEKLLLIIKAIKQQCDVTENYEMNEFIRQLENEPVDSKWLKRVAGDE